MQSLKDKNSWAQIALKYDFDNVYGYLIPQNYKPLSFDFESINNLIKKLPQLNANGQVIETIKNLPQFNYQNVTNYRDIVILRDCMLCFTSSYQRAYQLLHGKDHQHSLPDVIGKPLYYASNKLGVKYGLSANIQYNWVLIQEVKNMDDLSIDSIKLKWYFTDHQYDERLFFGASVVSSYFLWQIFKLNCEINDIIEHCPQKQDQIIERFGKIRFYWGRILKQTNLLANKLDANFFFNELRIYLMGFKDLLIQGLGVKISSSGGNGGTDPSFQLFQRAFGITFENDLELVQVEMRKGMYQKHKELLNLIKQWSKIRQYCSFSQKLTNQYNLTLQSYVNFLKTHSSIIQNFVLKFHVNKLDPHGTGQVQISKMVERHKIVQLQKIQFQKSNPNRNYLQKQNNNIII